MTQRRRPSRKHWDPRGGDPHFQKLAEQVVAESKNIPDFFYRGDLPLGKTWAMTFSKSAASDLGEVSNFETIQKDLEERFADDVTVESFSHWVVNWVERIMVRMLDEDGTVTQAGMAVLDWREKLDDYPLADEEDHSRREYEATIENIKEAASVDEADAIKIYTWLANQEGSEEELDPQDGRGAWPSDDALRQAQLSLGLVEPEEGEALPPPPPYYDPDQMTLWPS